MPLDSARYEVEIGGVDRTGAAFASVEARLRSFQSTTRSMNVGQSLGRDFDGLVGMVGRLAPALTAGAAAWKVFSAGMATADLGEQAQQLAVTTDQLQAYRLLAIQSGVSNEQLDASLMKLAKAMGTAGQGNDEMIARFEKLGVKLLDADGQLRKVGSVLPELASKLLAVSSETERSALMQELFGRSGARMVTILEGLAQGNEALVESGRRSGAIVSPENIAKWDALSDALNRSKTNTDALFVTLTAPAAQAAADLMGRLAKNTEAATAALNQLPKDASFMEKLDAIFGGRQGKATMGGYRLASPSEMKLFELDEAQKRLADLEAKRANLPGVKGALRLDDQIARQRDLVASLEAGYRAAAKEAENAADMQRLLGEGLPARDAPRSDGVRNPTGDGARKAGINLADQQRKEGDEFIRNTIAEWEKLDKAGQALQERFGSGKEFRAREVGFLDELLGIGALGHGPEGLAVYEQALADIDKRAADMERSFRGAQGGVDGFFAGFEQGIADMAEANSAFAIGKAAVDSISSSIADLAMGAEVNFDRMLQSFLKMILEMTIRWAIFQALTAAFGGSGLGGGGGLFNFLGGLLGFADGGRPPVGRPSIVGERGPELFVPDRPGMIYNRGQLAGMGDGGGAPVIVQQTIQVGSFATRSEMIAMGHVIEKSAREGAMAAIADRRQRGDVRYR